MSPTPGPGADIASSELSAWWDALLGAAVLGTARTEPPSPPAALGVAAPGERGREATLLDQASLADRIERSDPPIGTATPLATAPEEHRSAASEPATRALEDVLREVQAESIPARMLRACIRRWLELAVAQDVVVPPRAVRELMRMGPEVRLQEHLAAWGTRGQWLLSDAGAEPPVAVPLDALADRLPGLSGLAAVDAVRDAHRRDPGATIDALRSVWRRVPAQIRIDILVVALVPDLGEAMAHDPKLSGGVSALWYHVLTPDGGSAGETPVVLDEATEAFLEDALDDRSVKVRDAARRQLERVPGSRYVARMTERLRALVTVDDGPDGRPVITVATPARDDVVVDDVARRDGLRDLADGSGPDVDHWLGAIIRSAAPTVWTDAVPGELGEIAPLVHAALSTPHQGDLEGAIRTHRATAWARAFLDAGLGSEYAMVKRLPLGERQAWATARLGPDSGTTNIPHSELRSIPGPWPRQLGDVALDRCVPPLRVPGQYGWDGVRVQDRNVFMLENGLTPRIPASLEPRMRALIDADRTDERYEQLRDSLERTLRLRELETAIERVFA